MRALVPTIAFLLMLAAGPLEAADAKIVLLPLSNVSGSEEAPGVFASLFEKKLREEGWSVVPAAEVESFLEEQRVRYLDSVDAATREALFDRFGATALLLGSILDYRDGANPAVALSARMIDRTGGPLWGDAAALTGAAAEGMLGLGRPEDAAALAKQVARRVLQSLPRPGRKGELAAGNPAVMGRPHTYRSALHPRDEVLRVCVLPFSSREPVASRVMLDLLSVRLGSTGEFETVEPAEFRAAMRAEKIRSVAEMTSAELARVGARLGTTLFLRGNVHTYREGYGGRTEVQLDLNLSDVADGGILWAAAHQRRGSDYSGLFQRGTIDGVVALSDRVLSEAVSAYRSARLRAVKHER